MKPFLLNKAIKEEEEESSNDASQITLLIIQGSDIDTKSIYSNFKIKITGYWLSNR